MTTGLAGRLVQARAKRGYSQLDLASLSGVAAAQISRYESGRSTPRPEVASRIAQALHIPFEWLLYGEEPSLAPFQKTAPSESEVSEATPQSAHSEKSMLRRVYENPINIDSAQLQKLAMQLVSFHTELTALQSALARLEKSRVDHSAYNGIERQIAAVEADILDTQEEIRILVKE